MLFRAFKALLWFLLLGLLTTILLLGLGFLTPQTVIAAVTQLEESPGHLLYRSHQRLQDQSGQTWQVVLFKSVYSDAGEAQTMTSLNLRLVGLPGTGEILHPKALTIVTSQGKILAAPDVFLEDAPAPTIGQYNLTSVVKELSNDRVLLTIPLAGKEDVSLSVPREVVQEWQLLAEIDPKT
jgi:Protein of unknown function (DUF3122)